MNPPARALHADGSPAPSGRVTLLEVLDRTLNQGVMIHGQVTLSVADVDLIFLGLKVLLTSVETAERLRGERRWGESAGCLS